MGVQSLQKLQMGSTTKKLKRQESRCCDIVLILHFLYHLFYHKHPRNLPPPFVPLWLFPFLQRWSIRPENFILQVHIIFLPPANISTHTPYYIYDVFGSMSIRITVGIIQSQSSRCCLTLPPTTSSIIIRLLCSTTRSRCCRFLLSQSRCFR